MILLLGLIRLLQFVFDVGQFLRAYYWTPARKIADLGSWVVITGATDGIGKAFATELAKRKNVNLALVGRNSAKLAELESEIQAIPGFSKSVKTVIFDFAKDGAAKDGYQKLADQISSLEVGCLINNVGVSYPSALFYSEVDDELLNELIEVNVRATLKVTRMVYGSMVARNRGAIVCIGSGASELAEPMLAGYAGAKGAVEAFCRSLQAECRQHNVLVQCQTPLLVTSKMSKIRKSSFFVPSATAYAKAGLRFIEGARTSGIVPSPTTISPYPPHYALLYLLTSIPVQIWETVRLGQQKETRSKYLKKLQDTSKAQ